ncbi:hypothetical protein AK830_g4257 [Neonectria ditissima]|uniref:Aminoglycoside phosphotransferase domain-containing protein n=1 Tax=Neonectria ditissima TaxID=78410 RepID=A0A0P7B955_9HYPO|nr:hypothetical protein AK830_g4257 [Neonectria ditissima]
MIETANINPTHLQDVIVEKQLRDMRDQFIQSIRADDIRRLAASYHPSQSDGEFFQDPIRGSYNICYFIRFPQPPSSSLASSPDLWDKWVVRVPLTPYLPFGADKKLEGEIAAMELVSAKTSIPLPNVIAYAINEKSKPFPTFMILEFVEGKKLSHKAYQEFMPEQRLQFYASLADIFIQLRRLEFDAIGRLLRREDGSFTVSSPIATMDLNAQALEGLQPSQVLARHSGGGPLQSAGKYVDMLHDLADNAFAKSRSSVLEGDSIGEEYLYHLHSFREHVKDWRAENDDQGPFVLVHGDFQPFNLLVDDQGSIVSVLDWEWSRVVPRQFFKPPLWLQYADLTLLSRSLFYDRFLKTLQDFLGVVRQRELEKYGNTMLADEWNGARERQGFLVANALESWTHVDWLMHNQGDSEGLEERIREFMGRDPRRVDLVARKVRDGEAYKVDIQRLARARCVHTTGWLPAGLSKLSSQVCQSVAAWERRLCMTGLTPGLVILFICGGGFIIGFSRPWRWLHRTYSRFYQ